MKTIIKTNSDQAYSLNGVHMPENKPLTLFFEKISFILNDLVLAISLMSLIAWSLHFPMQNVVFSSIFFSPVTSCMFILAGIALIFSAKYYTKTLNKKPPLTQNTLLAIGLSGITAVSGLLCIFNPMLGSYIPPVVGFTFVLLGFALMLPHIKVNHRFHINQALTFTVLILNAITILGYIYQLAYASHIASPLIPIPLPIALKTSILSFSILLRWSNRGFLGNFTTQSLSSTFALRLLIVNFIISPLIGFITLYLTQKVNNIYLVIALLVILLVVVATALAWSNVKLLYQYELERFAMREALRVHNINLTLDKKTQDVKIETLEEKEKEYRKKLDYQDKFRDISDSLG